MGGYYFYPAHSAPGLCTIPQHPAPPLASPHGRGGRPNGLTERVPTLFFCIAFLNCARPLPSQSQGFQPCASSPIGRAKGLASPGERQGAFPSPRGASHTRKRCRAKGRREVRPLKHPRICMRSPPRVYIRPTALRRAAGLLYCVIRWIFCVCRKGPSRSGPCRPGASPWSAGADRRHPRSQAYRHRTLRSS